MAEVAKPAPPHGRYKRRLADADFSLEANTESVPADGRFYVMRNDEVVMASEDFEEATTEYHRLCRGFWEARLEDPSPQVRVAAAWGLLGLDSGNKQAQAIIQQDGTPQEKKRLEQAQSRRRALRARNAPKVAREKPQEEESSDASEKEESESEDE
ncbi:MAG: hypothetical protein ACK47B_04825 [Armatimonadota bacterium]